MCVCMCVLSKVFRLALLEREYTLEQVKQSMAFVNKRKKMLSIAIRERLTNFFSSLGPNVCVCMCRVYNNHKSCTCVWVC